MCYRVHASRCADPSLYALGAVQATVPRARPRPCRRYRLQQGRGSRPVRPRPGGRRARMRPGGRRLGAVLEWCFAGARARFATVGGRARKAVTVTHGTCREHALYAEIPDHGKNYRVSTRAAQMNPDGPTRRRCGRAGQLQLASSGQTSCMSRNIGILPVQGGGRAGKDPGAQKRGDDRDEVPRGQRGARPHQKSNGVSIRLSCPGFRWHS